MTSKEAEELVNTPSMYTGERRPGAPLSAAPVSGAPTGAPIPVTITDVKIHFFSLMWLLVKLAFASIPAAFIVAVIWTILIGIMGFIVHTFGPQAGTPFSM